MALRRQQTGDHRPLKLSAPQRSMPNSIDVIELGNQKLHERAEAGPRSASAIERGVKTDWAGEIAIQHLGEHRFHSAPIDFHCDQLTLWQPLRAQVTSRRCDRALTRGTGKLARAHFVI